MSRTVIGIRTINMRNNTDDIHSLCYHLGIQESGVTVTD
jgi:hypothetical protein